MHSFSESNLLFQFPDDWVVRKFDDTIAYQSLSGHGLKGVDFIALSPDGKLWLVEVKNLRPNVTDSREYFAKRRKPDDLARHVWFKFRDSHRLLQIVVASLERKWWYSVWKWYRSWLPSPNNIYWFWMEAHRRAEDETRLSYVLWMETPEGGAHYSAAVEEHLRSALPHDTLLWVVEMENNQDIPFQVTAQRDK